MIHRMLSTKLMSLSKQFPVVTLTGPRQSGKTTLCKAIFTEHSYVSLEAPDHRSFAIEDPRGFLDQFSPPVIIDEVQRAPDLLSYIQVAVDERRNPGQFVLTGSANLALLESVRQSLAGRSSVTHLLPCEHSELLDFSNAPDQSDLFTTLYSGAYPAVFDRSIEPYDWYRSYITTSLERDVRQLVNVSDVTTFQSFLELTAGRTAQLTNFTQLGADAGVTANTAKKWLSVLETGFLVHRLRPFFSNVTSRIVKTPKLYFYDTGLACALLGIFEPAQIRSHPLRGALFENWVVSEIVKMRLHRGMPPSASFFRDRKGFEVDLLVETGDTTVAAEIKSGQTVAGDYFANLERLLDPDREPSIKCPLEPRVIYGGSSSQARRGIKVVPWNTVKDLPWW